MSIINKSKLYSPNIVDHENAHRLYLNENLYPLHPGCLDALSLIPESRIRFYTASKNNLIEEAIADTLQTGTECLVLNHGAAEIIKQIYVMMRTMEKNTVCICTPAWPYYTSLAHLFGFTIIDIPLLENKHQYNFDIKKLLELQSNQPSLLVLNSPHMPTGGFISYEKVKIIAKTLPKTCILLDEAYWGFSESINFNTYNQNILLSECSNVIIVRTFSKFYGLASLRIGFALTNKNLAEDLTLFGPLFGLSYPAQLIASTVLKSKEYYHKKSGEIQKSRDVFIKHINNNSQMTAYVSTANFVLIKVPLSMGSKIISKLAKAGYHVRNCNTYELAGHFRITIGSAEIMHNITSILESIISD
jgi:histidinol-phosphate aminotransferase